MHNGEVVGCVDIGYLPREVQASLCPLVVVGRENSVHFVPAPVVQEVAGVPESELALATADLCLEVKAATREVQGYSEMTVLVPCSSPFLIEGLEAGVNHNKLIKERKGENVGSPHGKVAEASLRGLATIPQIKGTKLENSLSKFWTEVVMKEDSKLMESEVQVFRATKPKVPSKKTFAFGEEPYGRIVFRFAPMRPSSSLAASVEEDLISFCKTMNWEVMVGTAPRSLKERRLAELKAMASR